MTAPDWAVEAEKAAEETKRLQRELDITNADHIALWIEANTIPDEPMNQCASWLACRIVEAHEAAALELSRRCVPIEEYQRVVGALRAIRDDQGPASDWAAKFAELQMWTASAFLAGERVKDAGWHKVELRSFLTGLFGYFMAAEEACNRAAAALKETGNAER